MGSNDLALNPLVIKGQCMLWAITLEDIKILNSELIVFVPPDPQALVSCATRLALLELGSVQ